ncbi:hypothetical protein ABEY57_13435 [Bacillus tropicus]
MTRQCAYCQGLYELEDSDSEVPKVFCSQECEINFEKHIAQVDIFFEN